MNEVIPLLCEECKQPISENSPRFWGRDGGEWHPLCLHALEQRGCAVRGMWFGTTGCWESPEEYRLAKIGLIEGAGI